MIDSGAYRLDVHPKGLFAILSSPSGEEWMRLALLSAFDTMEYADETLAVEPPRVGGDTVEVDRRSTVWDRAGMAITCRDDRLEIRSWVEGDAALADVHLLGGHLLAPDLPSGPFASGVHARSLYSPNPGNPAKLTRAVGESAVIGVSGDGAPGRGHWFFTPAPLWLGFETSDDEWLGLGLAAPVEELRFVQAEYRPGDGAFHLVLDYEGHTRVRGRFEAPLLVLTPGEADPVAGLRRHRDDLASRGFVPARSAERAEWWSEPMFCGWGAQCHLAAETGGHAPDFATQVSYDGFLNALEAHGVVPGTVVIDDKWQAEYGTNTPDERKWPDLEGWIADRHARGQKVLLWWKAWDAEGLRPGLCIRNADRVPLVFDPTNPEAREALRTSIRAMLHPDGLDADGLKIDFTARTPSGRSLTLHGDNWGIALLHELLEVVYAEAKAAKADALLITQTPNPSFVDVADMVRLNDMLRLDDPGPLPDIIPQMRFRAAVARAACPELLIDTDDWTISDKQTWREYVDVKIELGVPSLYYATHLDLTGEPLLDEDYELVRRSWARRQAG